MKAGLDELERRVPGAKLGATGFCFGGGMVWALLDAGDPRLAAAIPFYGPAPAAPDFSGNTAAVLGVYAELDDRSNRLACVLRRLGAGEDRTVAVVLPNCLEFFDVAGAAAKLQAPFLPVNWHLKAEELGYVLADSGASVTSAGNNLK